MNYINYNLIQDLLGELTMKKYMILISIVLVLGSGCSKNKYEDGFYFAAEDSFSESGYKYVAMLEVEDGQIVDAVWNGAYIEGGPDKVTRSASGQYGMLARGGARSEWDEQAALAEEFLLKTQDPTAVKYTDEEGHTDDISGVSIHVKEFFILADKALKAGPTKRGPYIDGAYHAEEPEFAANGWKYFVDITVLGGNIVAVSWDGINKEGGDLKKTRSKNGEYVMVEGGTPWHVQAEAVQNNIIKTQDPTKITYIDDAGHTDDITGVSIHVIEFYELAEKALERARR